MCFFSCFPLVCRVGNQDRWTRMFFGGSSGFLGISFVFFDFLSGGPPTPPTPPPPGMRPPRPTWTPRRARQATSWLAPHAGLDTAKTNNMS